MKTNIKKLKDLVNAHYAQIIYLCLRGVQAYGIADGEEYTAIVGFEKTKGRYYFFDNCGRRFLASHYYNAEFVAGEMLEVIAQDSAAAQEAAHKVAREGATAIPLCLTCRFVEECERLGLEVENKQCFPDERGGWKYRYELKQKADQSSKTIQP